MAKPWAYAIQRELAKAGIRMAAGKYLPTAAITSLAIFALSVLFFLKNFSGQPNALFYAVMISIPIGTISLSMFYAYPLMRASSRAKEIDEKLPIALYHISAAGCKNLRSFFTMLCGRGNYGALSEEATKALYYVNSLGADPKVAALKAAETTPSIELKGFLLELSRAKQNSLNGFIKKEAKERLAEYKTRLGQMERKHGAFAEGYAVFMILFPILLIAFAYASPMLWVGIYLAVPLINILLLAILYRLEAWDVTN